MDKTDRRDRTTPPVGHFAVPRVVEMIRRHASWLEVDGPRRVFVVDDEPAVAGFARCVLRSAGYETVVATNGPEALQLMDRSEPFDLLVTDFKMPTMTGTELAQRVRERSPEIRILYMSGDVDALLLAKRTAWSEEAFLAKPLAIEELLSAVMMLLYGSAGRRRDGDSNRQMDR